MAITTLFSTYVQVKTRTDIDMMMMMMMMMTKLLAGAQYK